MILDMLLVSVIAGRADGEWLGRRRSLLNEFHL